MKNYFKVSFIILLLLVCVGCDAQYAKPTRAFRHSGYALSGGVLNCPELIPEEKDAPVKKVKYYTGTHAILEDGTIYLISLGQVFQNGTNCKKADPGFKVVSMFDNSVVKADDGRIYYLNPTNNLPAFSVVPQNDNNYQIYNAILNDGANAKAMTYDSSNGIFYVLRDGSVFVYRFTKVQGGNGAYVFNGSSLAYDKSEYGTIIDFNYAGENTGTYFRTDTAFYKYIAQNKEECYQYADVECKFKLEKDEGLTEFKDYVFAYNGGMLITTYKKEFNLAK